MPHCQYCNINPCKLSEVGTPFTYQQKHCKDKTIHCLPHHFSLIELADCAFNEDGCVLCELFLLHWYRSGSSRTCRRGGKVVEPPEGNERFQVKWLTDYWDMQWNKNLEAGEGFRLYVSLSTWDLQPGLTLWRIRFPNEGVVRHEDSIEDLSFFFRRSLPEDSSELTKAIWRREINHNARDPNCLALAMTWFQSCLQNHEICNTFAPAEAVLPTRVIDIGLNGTTPRLLLTESRSAQFAALSYCWGKDVGFGLISDNLRDLQRNIPISQLPQVMNDAILVTRALGIRYLWIDAICIIQDLNEDWVREAARMHEVFGRATVVLVAESSASARESFLTERYVSPTCSLPWTPSCAHPHESEQTPARVSVGFKDGLLSNNRGSSYGSKRNGLGNSFDPQWESRGWTLQECLSAARSLSFGIYEMEWRCLCVDAHEDGRTEEWLVEQNRCIDSMLGRGSGLINGRFASHSITGIQKTWTALTRCASLHQARMSNEEYDKLLIDQFQETVNHFRRRNFTFRSDLLAATAGLAQVAEDKLAGRAWYWAGLWSNNLAIGLLWGFIDPKQNSWPLYCQDSQQLHAYVPSWSWASVSLCTYDLSPSHPSTGTEGLSLLKDVQFPDDLKDSERFIPQSPIPLKFRAPFYRLSDNWLDEKEVHNSPDVPFVLFEKALRDEYFNEGGYSKTTSEFEVKHQPYVGQHFAAIQVYKYCKVVSSKWGGPKNISTQPAMRFLILESVQSGEVQCYRRVMMLELPRSYGHFSVHSPLLQWKDRPIFVTDAYQLVNEHPWDEADITLI